MNAAQTIQSSAAQSPKLEATELVAPPAIHWPTIPGLSGAMVLFTIGFVILFKVRREVRADDIKTVAIASRFSASTRILAALSCLIGGYHLCAWSLDERLLPLRVPVERGWIVLVVAVLAIAASAGVDLIQRRFDADHKTK